MPTLAILKLDKISDYVIFRNYIEVVKKSKKYKDYKILLIGNIEYKNFARFLDGEIVDKFIWINKNNYKKFPFYRTFILNEINSLKIDDCKFINSKFGSIFSDSGNAMIKNSIFQNI